MMCLLILTFIAPLLCYVTTVNAYLHGGLHFRPGFGGYPPIGNDGVEISALDPAFRFAGICSRWQPYRHRWVPDFLNSVSSDGMNDFCDIVMNANLTKAEAVEQLSQWAQNQGGDVQEQFNTYLEQERQRWMNIQQKIHELIENVTHFINEVETLQNDMSLTKRVERENLLVLVTTTDRVVLSLAKKIRDEAGFVVGEYRRGPCLTCGPRFPPIPPFQHYRPRFGLGVRGRWAQFSGDDGATFGQNGHFGHDGRFEWNGQFGQNGPFEEVL